MICRSLFYFFFFFFPQSLLLISVIASSAAAVSPAATYLLQFRDSLPSQSQHLLQWNNLSSSPCQWRGVSCYPDTPTPQIMSLNFTNLGLSAVLNDSVSYLCLHEALVSLDLGRNNFTGILPPQLGNCSQLDTIVLGINQLVGPIPPELFQSKKLTVLDLSYNGFSGEIPKQVASCTSLQYLGLENNTLDGEIPMELFTLPNLETLYLISNRFTGSLPDFPPSCALSNFWVSENRLSGSLPVSLRNCRNLTLFVASGSGLVGEMDAEIFTGLVQLKRLALDRNKLEGEIPESLWAMGNLDWIDLSTNQLSGTLSEKIAHCQQLTSLALSGNQLVGPIPPSIGDLKNLKYLYLYSNKLNGTLPPQLGNCSALIDVRLDDNLIEGSIPPEISFLEGLEVLYLFQNRITGEIPRRIGGLKRLKELALYENKLNGGIPSEIAELTQLQFLSLSHNNLTGVIPSELGKYSPLVKLDLIGNSLSGPVPSSLCAGNKLSVLVLGHNQLNGSFPLSIGACSSLYRLILSHNQLQGAIPPNIGKNTRLSYLEISSNLLEGSIPPVLGYWSNLSTVDFSGNRLSGSIPPELGKLAKLHKLHLSSNMLTGSIPPELSNCKKLIELDLSGNSISGNIPNEILALERLAVVLLQGNNLTGAIPDSFSPLQDLRSLQLANNMLETPLPCSLSRIRQFSSVLNVSHNNFSGQIPTCLGNLDHLEALDLSSNNFSGEIPSQLKNMAALNFFNISFNEQLYGRIPASWEKIAAKHPGSSLGNPGICITSNDTRCGRRARHGRMSGGEVAAVVITVIGTMAIVCAMVYVFIMRVIHQKLECDQSLLHESTMRSESLPDDLRFEDIIRAAESCNEIGRGRHGTVYWTESVHSRKKWAVKKVNNLSESDFIHEIRILNMVKHRNAVKIGGYCIAKGDCFIVTEYMPGGTLSDVLHREQSWLVLDWEDRLRIALGIAQCLSYLHHDCVPQIIHRDVKSDNVLLDSDLEPKVADFGMAKLGVNNYPDAEQSSSTVSKIVGTLGYMAPENAYSTMLTDKVDVYSYGVILLELVCRKMPVDPSFEEGQDIACWARKNVEGKHDGDDEGSNFIKFVDNEITSWDPDKQEKAKKLLELGLECTQPVPEMRPSMRDVVASLLKLGDANSSVRFK
ncbi:unnamed protein product [Linum trigynum]|uniref:non-specific serine/threonine protein kinase n=1 Tax=Linum trigynum TaxID=586398 RepID=A0AAV2G483_9ROSI